MGYLTTDQVKDWAQDIVEDTRTFYCEHCLTILNKTGDGKWYCPNEMCLWDEELVIEQED